MAGNVGYWEREGRRLVGYWIGREFRGKGLATVRFKRYREVTQRPLHAWVATSNSPRSACSKCGFVHVGSQKNDLEELLFDRDSPGTPFLRSAVRACAKDPLLGKRLRHGHPVRC